MHSWLAEGPGKLHRVGAPPTNEKFTVGPKPSRTGSATSRAARMAMTAMMGECALVRRRQGR